MSEKKKWRVGWRAVGAAKSKPVYAPGEYDSFTDADYVRKEMQRSFPGFHVFVDTITPKPVAAPLDAEAE